MTFEKMNNYGISVNLQCYLKSPNLRFAWHLEIFLFLHCFVLIYFLLHCVPKLHCLRGV